MPIVIKEPALITIDVIVGENNTEIEALPEFFVGAMDIIEMGYMRDSELPEEVHITKKLRNYYDIVMKEWIPPHTHLSFEQATALINEIRAMQLAQHPTRTHEVYLKLRNEFLQAYSDQIKW